MRCAFLGDETMWKPRAAMEAHQRARAGDEAHMLRAFCRNTCDGLVASKQTTQRIPPGGDAVAAVFLSELPANPQRQSNVCCWTPCFPIDQPTNRNRFQHRCATSSLGSGFCPRVCSQSGSCKGLNVPANAGGRQRHLFLFILGCVAAFFDPLYTTRFFARLFFHRAIS
jgi:hypothetical protein